MFSCLQGLSNDDVGVGKVPVFQGFKTGDFVKEKLGWGGYRKTARSAFAV